MRASSLPARRADPSSPSPAERRVLESCADQAILLGRQLYEKHHLVPDGRAPVELTSATTIEFLLLGVRTAAKQHLQRGDDLLALIERTGAMLDAARGARPEGSKTDAGLHLLRGIAMAELVHAESRGRFARHMALRELADTAMTGLVAGYLARFGGELPTEVRKAFPGFAAALREAWRPIQARRGLLLWLTPRS
jgi:hypothetical protein